MKISFLGGVQQEEEEQVESPPSSSGESSSPLSLQLQSQVKELERKVAELEFALGLSEGVVTSQEGYIAYLLLKIEQLNARLAGM